MSNEKKATTWVHTPRKATFTVTLVKGVRKFTAVNKRAHRVARKFGKRTVLTLDQMKQVKAEGYYKPYAYDAKGALKAIKF